MLEPITKSLIGILFDLGGKFLQGIYELWLGPLKYRDTVQLRHIATNGFLHSHHQSYRHPNSSGQQQVTVYHGSDTNNYWVAKGPNGQPELYKEGQPIRHGDIIRLEHLNSKRNLHSHRGIPSPITNQQEVAAFGDNDSGDFNDNWRVEVKRGSEWRENLSIRLIHVDTNYALHSHYGHSHHEYTDGQ